MLSKLATQSFNILRLIARNPNFLRPKVPYFNVSLTVATENDPKWPTITPNGPKMTPGFTYFFQELCEPISLSLERALSSEIGSQDPCSARNAVPAFQHFMLLWKRESLTNIPR